MDTNTEQGQLSEQYSDLKVKYDALRRRNSALSSELFETRKQVLELTNKVEEYVKQENENESNLRFIKDGDKRKFVTETAYNKQRARTGMFEKLFWYLKNKEK